MREDIKTMPMIKWMWVSAAVLVLDLVTKAVASESLSLHYAVNVFPGLNMTLMHNEGAAFSFLSDQKGWQRWFFSIVAVLVSVGIIIWMTRLNDKQRLLSVALALILGGAVGNVWDRITLGYVVDFIDVYVGSYHWPAFNIADSAISVGAVLILIDAFIMHKAEKDSSSVVP